MFGLRGPEGERRGPKERWRLQALDAADLGRSPRRPAKALDLEYGDAAEKEAISTWMTLELEARPKQHFDDMGTDLATCTRFVADVEKAVKEKCVTIETLCEKWGTPEVKPKPKVVSLGDVKGDISAQQQEQVPRRSQPTGADGDSIDDDSIDRDLGGEPNADGRPGGDGRYN